MSNRQKKPDARALFKQAKSRSGLSGAAAGQRGGASSSAAAGAGAAAGGGGGLGGKYGGKNKEEVWVCVRLIGRGRPRASYVAKQEEVKPTPSTYRRPTSNYVSYHDGSHTAVEDTTPPHRFPKLAHHGCYCCAQYCGPSRTPAASFVI